MPAASPRASSRRAQKPPIATTTELAQIIRAALPPSKERIDPATRSFQALRIRVNDELGEIARGLAEAASLLAPGGRLVAIAFHSLEDRLVKRFMAEAAGRAARALAPRPAPRSRRPPRAFAC